VPCRRRCASQLAPGQAYPPSYSPPLALPHPCPLSPLTPVTPLSKHSPMRRHLLLCPFPSHPQNALRLSLHSIPSPSSRRLPPCLLCLRHNVTRSAPTWVTPITVPRPSTGFPRDHFSLTTLLSTIMSSSIAPIVRPTTPVNHIMPEATPSKKVGDDAQRMSTCSHPCPLGCGCSSGDILKVTY
jgi:hypothetical protein